MLPYQLETTNDLLTSRPAGLLSIAELMNSLGLADRINTCFPQPGSNRGFKPSVFMETLILMQHEGGFHLDDVRYVQEDVALQTLLGLEQTPQAVSLGNWLRRMGKHPNWTAALTQVNQTVLQSTLHKRKAITLDIDAPENAWQPLLSHKGDATPGPSTYRTLHFMGDYEQAFTVVVQRKELKGQVDLEVLQSDEEVCAQGYIYRAIATNRETMTDSQIIHWYNQRGEDSENRIKELKLDFGGDTLPCSDFDANAVYFSICALAYNL